MTLVSTTDLPTSIFNFLKFKQLNVFYNLTLQVDKLAP